MPEPSVEVPASLMVEAETPWGAKYTTVPLDATVGEYVDKLVKGCGANPQDGRYVLEVPLGTNGGDPEEFYTVDREEKLLDALRGVQHRPHVTPRATEA